MATFTKLPLSGSTNGLQIKITPTVNGSAATLHTAVAGTSSWDEIYLYAYNHDTVTRNLIVLWGGTSEPDNVIKAPVLPQSGRILICDGLLLQNGLLVKAYADAANVIIVDGFVNRIT